jgi:hypothetical protein
VRSGVAAYADAVRARLSLAVDDETLELGLERLAEAFG